MTTDTFYSAYTDTGLFGFYFTSSDIPSLKTKVNKALLKLKDIQQGNLVKQEVESAIKAVKVNGGSMKAEVTVEMVVRLVKEFGKMSVSCVGPDELPWADELI